MMVHSVGLFQRRVHPKRRRGQNVLLLYGGLANLALHLLVRSAESPRTELANSLLKNSLARGDSQ